MGEPAAASSTGQGAALEHWGGSASNPAKDFRIAATSCSSFLAAKSACVRCWGIQSHKAAWRCHDPVPRARRLRRAQRGMAGPSCQESGTETSVTPAPSGAGATDLRFQRPFVAEAMCMTLACHGLPRWSASSGRYLTSRRACWLSSCCCW